MVQPFPVPVVASRPPARRILVVDDEPLIRWSLTQTLLEHGWDVEEADSGAGALAAVRDKGTFDVIVLDYRLPDSNDLELLRSIRRLVPETAVIMMTAFGTPEVVQGALDLGAFRVIAKPFEVDDLADLAAHAR